MNDKFYITTAIPYPNGKPHLGFALEILQADILARYHRLIGDRVFFLTGVDEHGLKVFQSAQKEEMEFQAYVDRNSAEFLKLKGILNLSFDDFIRTTDRQRHWPGAQKLWLENKNDIYLKEYAGSYCIGCESFVTEKELENGLCPEHKTKPELVKEKNYFFKLGNYKSKIRKAIESDELKIVPDIRKNELLNLLNDAEDFSISRPVEKISWGIPVPGDPSQVFYVWYDALANYITAIGYGRDEENFKKWWPADVHCIGKGILRFHAIYWPAMLLSAGLPLPRNIFVHGYLTVEGEKISKSLGNVTAPENIVKKYGADTLRFYLLREISTFEDGDFSIEKLEARYNGDLANNLGNLISRVAKLIETKLVGELVFEEKFLDKELESEVAKTQENYERTIAQFKLHETLTSIWKLFDYANTYINDNKPWADVADHPEHFLKTMTSLLFLIINAAKMLEPFIPETAEKIFRIYGHDREAKKLEGRKFVVTKVESLFPRLK